MIIIFKIPLCISVLTDIQNVRPALALPGHEAPLSIEFYDGRGCDVNPGALPCSETGNAIVTFHGSYFKEIPGGFSVTLISFDQITGSPLGNIRDLIVEEDRMKCKLSGIADCFRPVSAIVDNQGRIVFTADYSGEVFRLFYNYDPPALLLP
jgi:glucose/arabinose dehydrogenase